MSNLNSALQQLRDERKQAHAQLEKLDQAISVIEGLSDRTNTRISNGSRRGRSLSAAARKRISEAQRARWALRKKQAGAASSAGPRAVPTRRPLSASARRRIAAAQKARWAKFRSQQKAAA
jgi:predicted  nucleic acid-binding Zn-ribbon protein